MDLGLTFTDVFIGNTGPSSDLSITKGDFTPDNGLMTSVIISLFTDRLAEDDDFIPDGTGNRRGWWGDAPLDGDNTGETQYLIGSRLWLLRREKQTTNTLNRGIIYCKEALQWMLDDEVAQHIDVQAQWGSTGNLLGQMILTITIYEFGSTAQPNSFQLFWNATLGIPINN
jgi:phage gp46-like protein